MEPNGLDADTLQVYDQNKAVASSASWAQSNKDGHLPHIVARHTQKLLIYNLITSLLITVITHSSHLFSIHQVPSPT